MVLQTSPASLWVLGVDRGCKWCVHVAASDIQAPVVKTLDSCHSNGSLWPAPNSVRIVSIPEVSCPVLRWGSRWMMRKWVFLVFIAVDSTSLC